MLRAHLRTVLLHHEHFEPVPYLDSEGCWTVGCGHLLTGPGEPLPPEHSRTFTDTECYALLEVDLDEALRDAQRNVRRMTALAWSDLFDGRRAALVEQAFQLGQTKQRKFPDMWRALARKRFDLAALEMLDSRWHRQTPKRSVRCALQLATGHVLDNDLNPLREFRCPTF